MTKVQVLPYGMLHDYVPFYFASQSPMLYAIKNGGVEGYKGNQSDIIYLVTNIKRIKENYKEFVFTDGHAIMKFTEFYNDLEKLEEIDWEVMRSKYWFDDADHPDRKRRRQAEFLVHKYVELDLFLGIGVSNQRMKDKVNEILKEHYIDMEVLIKPDFFY